MAWQKDGGMSGLRRRRDGGLLRHFPAARYYKSEYETIGAYKIMFASVENRVERISEHSVARGNIIR